MKAMITMAPREKRTSKYVESAVLQYHPQTPQALSQHSRCTLSDSFSNNRQPTKAATPIPVSVQNIPRRSIILIKKAPKISATTGAIVTMDCTMARIDSRFFRCRHLSRFNCYCPTSATTYSLEYARQYQAIHTPYPRTKSTCDDIQPHAHDQNRFPSIMIAKRSPHQSPQGIEKKECGQGQVNTIRTTIKISTHSRQSG